MEKVRSSILDNCGRYSEDLMEISKKVLEQKKLNGEKVTETDILDVEDDIFQSYQTILSFFKDGNNISLAIKNLKNDVINKGLTTNFKNLAISAVNNTIKQQENYEFQENNGENIIAGIVIANTIENKIESETLNKLFDEKLIQNMDEVLEKAKSGDVQASSEMETVKNATKFLGTHKELEGNIDRAALGWMLRLSECQSPMAKQVLEQMQEQYKEYFDVVEKNENGETIISTDKIRKELSQRVGKEKFEKLDFKKINERVGERAVEKGNYRSEKVPKDAATMVENLKREVRKANIKKMIKENSRTADGLEKIQEIYSRFPEEVKEILKEKIEIRNKIMDRAQGSGYGKLMQCQEEIMMLSEIIHEEKIRENMESKEARAQRKSDNEEFSL